MRSKPSAFVWVVVAGLLVASAAAAQEGVVPRVSPGGPAGLVTGLAFSPDGKTLYAAGVDKVVHVWQLAGGQWATQPPLRLPIGPGADGKLNALAVSADGRWLAAAGSGATRTRTGFRQGGIIIPFGALDEESRADQGVVYVIDLRTREVYRSLRGNHGAVVALAFAPRAGAGGTPPALASAGRHWSVGADFKGRVSVWDVEKATRRDWPGELPDPLTQRIARPGLAWATGQDASDDTLLLAWGDGTLRTWRVAAGNKGAAEGKDEPLNNAATPTADGSVAVGRSAGAKGYLRLWDVAGGAVGGTFPEMPGVDGAVPFAISAGWGDKATRVAAVVFAQTGDKRQLRLHVVNADRRSPAFGNLDVNLPLWPLAGRLPAVAFDPKGGHVAVAGEDTDAVDVYPLAAVRDGQVPRPVRLVGAGQGYASVSFARSGDRVGLLLSPERAAPAGPARVAFDFAKPGFVKVDGWRPDVAAVDDWQIASRRTKDEAGQVREVLTVSGPRSRCQIELGSGTELKKSAVSAAGPGHTVPVIAVSFLQFGEPWLRLYRADNGQPLRHLTGHDGPVLSLAFSADGRLLASVGADRTVCIWSLTDLGQALDRSSSVAGLAVKDGGKKVIVSHVDEKGPLAKSLRPGDRIEALTIDGGKPVAPATARQFYETVFHAKTTAAVRAEVAGKGAVALPLQQGVDERHPLLTLFTVPGERGQYEWVAWNPQGPYESSSPRGERYLGWHTNTGDAKVPASFAGAGKYRAKYEKRGLLGQLVAKGELDEAVGSLPTPVLPDPVVVATLGERPLDAALAGPDGVLLVQSTRKELRAAVHQYPREKLMAVQWSLDGKEWHPLGGAEGIEWTADLGLALTRGEHTLRLRLLTPGARRPQHEQAWRVRFQPPPPAVATEMPPRLFLMKDELAVEATVRGHGDEKVATRVLLNDRVMAETAGPAVKQSITVPKGTHVLMIVARNADALAGHEAAETTTLRFAVTYDPKAPRVAVNAVVPVGDEAAAEPIALAAGQEVVVSGPKVRIRGKVDAGEDLTEVTLAGRPVSALKPGLRSLDFDEAVTLTPGGHKLRVEAKTRNTEAAQVVALAYQPPLPALRLTPHQAEVSVRDEGAGWPPVVLRFRPQAAGSLKGTAATVLVNGKPLAEPSTVEASDAELAVRLVPRERDSQVQVQLRNEWRAPTTAAAVTVRALRPPYGLRFVDVPEKSERGVVDVVAEVTSPLPLEAAMVEATVNGRPLRLIELTKADGAAWRLRLKEVSLDAARGSENRIRVRVRNTDGEAAKAAEVVVRFTGPPVPRPFVVLHEPLGANVSDPRVLVRFTVRSPAALARLALVRDGGAALPLDLAGLPAGEDVRLALRLGGEGAAGPIKVAGLPLNTEGYREADAPLALEMGLNRLRIEAANEGGESTHPVPITLLPPPVRVVVDRLEVDDDKAVLNARPDGAFDGAAPAGKVWLVGRVLWGPHDDARLGGAQSVQVRVNGVQQVESVPLKKPGGARPRERTFRARVFLGQPFGNRLHVDLPGLEEDESARVEYVVDCKAPVAQNRILHLLIVMPGERDGKRVRSQVVAALNGSEHSSREFKLPSFDAAFVYGPVLGDGAAAKVYFELSNIRRRINLTAGQGPFSHVVMLYFQGGELIEPGGHFLQAPGAGDHTDDRIPCQGLQQAFAGMLGAQVLLMDVQRTGAGDGGSDLVARWSPESPVAVGRLAGLVRGGTPPERPRFIELWKGPLSRGVSLAQVEQEVRGEVQPYLKKAPEAVLYHQHIPKALRELAIGQAGP